MLNIRDIERIKEREAKEQAEVITIIKGFNVYFIDLGGYFGYSALVYKNGLMIDGANQYALHHSKKESKETLKAKYITNLNNRLFTDDELLFIKEYNDYNNKIMFLINDLPDSVCSVSVFNNKVNELKKQYHYLSNYYYYLYEEDAVKIDNAWKTLKKLHDEKMKDDPVYFKSAVYYELANHEAGYTSDYSEGLWALGLRYDNLTRQQQITVREVLKQQIKNSY